MSSATLDIRFPGSQFLLTRLVTVILAAHTDPANSIAQAAWLQTPAPERVAMDFRMDRCLTSF